MDETIKSAYERAMERAEKLGRASPAEMQKLEYTPKGNAIAAKFLTDDVRDLSAEIAKHAAEFRPHVVEGAIGTLSANITLPRDPRAKHAAAKALEGLQTLTDKKKQAQEVTGQIQQLFTYYEAALNQALTHARQEIEAKASDPHYQQAKARSRQPAADLQLEYQEAVRRARQTLDTQYEKVLEEHKQRLRKLLAPQPAARA